MKKMYITPAVEINGTMACEMMAISAINTPATNDDALVIEEEAWDIWED